MSAGKLQRSCLNSSVVWIELPPEAIKKFENSEESFIFVTMSWHCAE